MDPNRRAVLHRGKHDADRVQTHNIIRVKPLNATPYFNNCPNTSCNVVFDCFATLLFVLFF